MQGTKNLPINQYFVYENIEISNRLNLCDSITYNADKQQLAIPYYHLNGKPFKTPKGTPFVRFRNYAKDATNKYSSPTKASAGDYNTPLYYPKRLIQDHANGKIKGNTIVLTEGEFKAITAQNYDINCLSFAGISMYKDLGFSLYINELSELINAAKTKAVNIVLLYDADAIELKKLNNDRQQMFNRSAIGFLEVVFKVKTAKKINFYVGHITGENKGLDDVLNAASNPKQIVNAINNPSQPNDYFTLVKVHKTNYAKKVNSLFVCNSVTSFVERYKTQLLGQKFDFRYKSSTSTYQLSFDGKLTAENDFYQHFNNGFDFNFRYSNFAGDCIEDVATLLRVENKLLIKSATGSGKTTLTKNLEEYYPNGRLILLEPTRATAQQQVSYILTIGGNKLDLGNSLDSMVTTFSKAFNDKIINQNDFDNSLLIIDEAHELYKSFGFRAAECFFLECLITMFKKVLATTATPLVPFFRALNFATLELKKKVSFVPAAQVRICKTRPNKNGKIDYQQVIKDCSEESRKKGNKAFIYHVSKNNHVIKAIAAQDKKTRLFTADTTRNENKTLYNNILSTKIAFDSSNDYDVILTNSVLETGATFYDKNIDVYILFSNSHTEIVQASARFRNVEDVNYIIYLREKNNTGSIEAPANDLKDKELEVLQCPDRIKPDIYTSLIAATKTHKEKFSYSYTFYSLELDRIRAQNHYQLIGELSNNFVIDSAKFELPRTAAPAAEIVSQIKPCDILNNGIINAEMMQKALSVIQDQPNRLKPLEKLNKGYEFFAPAATIKTDTVVFDDTYQVLKLIIYIKDLLIKSKLDSENTFLNIVYKIDEILNFSELKQKADRFRIVENYILLEVLKKEPSKADQICNMGKYLAWVNILSIVKNHVGRYTIMDINSNRHLARLGKAEKYRLLDALNIPQLLIKQKEQTPSAPRQLNENAFIENRQLNTIKKQRHKINPLQLVNSQIVTSPEQNGTYNIERNCSGLVKHSNSIAYKGLTE